MDTACGAATIAGGRGRGRGRRLRIGMIAPEFPPGRGGMQAVSLGFARALARRHDVLVLTARPWAMPGEAFRVAPVLTGCALRDRPVLAGFGVDLWFALNAAHAALAPSLPEPLIAYVHGRDALAPWGIAPPGWAEGLRRLPGGWRVLEGLQARRGRQALRAGLPRCAGIIANSPLTGDRLQAAFPLGGGPLKVCPPGVEQRFFRPPHHRPAEGGLHLLSVARLDRAARRKNIDGVLRALRLCGPAVVARYLVVGEGDDRPRLEALRDTLGLGDRVRFLGPVPEEDLPALYGSADLHVLPVRPSRRDIEGFGIVFLEAAAAGLPSLGTRDAARAGAILDGETGLILEAATPAAIAAGLHRFQAMRATFRPERLQAFAAAFRWDAVGDALEAAVLACLDGVVR